MAKRKPAKSRPDKVRKSPRRKPIPAPDPATAYEEHKERSRKRQRALAREGIEIGPLPEIVDPLRRERCRLSLKLHLETYHPDVFRDPWSESQLDLIARAERVVLSGGQVAVAYERGGGKSVISEGAIEWAVLHGHKRYVFIITATDDKFGAEYLDSIKAELESNGLLLKDFPEVCHPIVCLEGTAQRARRQTLDGEPTHIGWKGSKRLVLPTVADSPSSGAVIGGSGLTGRGIRGSRFRTRDGRVIRPDLIVADDIQDDESAASVAQCDKYERLMNGAVLGMAGPGQSISVLFPCTIIQPGDLADRLTDREKNPTWKGLRSALLRAWPSDMELWEAWWEICRGELKTDDDLRATDHDPTPQGTAFIAKHFAEMHEGAEVSNVHRKERWQLSAVHHALWLYFTRGPLTYWSEFQNWIATPNCPSPPTQSADLRLDADELARKLSGHERGTMPADVQWVTSFIDVHDRVLFWMVCGWESDFTGYVLDYGTWPGTKRPIFAHETFRPTLKEKYAGQSLDGALTSGLTELTAALLSKDWNRQDGAKLQINLGLIDTGYNTKTIRRWVSRSPLRARLRTSFGRKCGPNETPITEWRTKAGELHGDDWLIRPPAAGNSVRHVLYDTYRWKSFVARRLVTPVGDPGCLSLPSGPKGKTVEHTLLARHLTSEYPLPTAGQWQVDEWNIRPGQTQNHYWDCLVGAAVAASICGARIDGGGSAPVAAQAPQPQDPVPRMTLPDGRAFFITAR